jgi:hypothetical protein
MGDAEQSNRVGIAVLSRLMAGDEVCYFKPWYEMRHPEETEKISKELAEWKMNHTDLVARLVDTLKGGDIYREEYFALDHPPIAGKVDVLHVLQGKVNLYEVKSGRKTHSHFTQLLLYLFLVAKDQRFRQSNITGHLVYDDQELAVTPDDVPPDLEDRIQRHVAPVLSEASPRKVRSSVCRFCWADCEFSIPRYGNLPPP